MATGEDLGLAIRLSEETSVLDRHHAEIIGGMILEDVVKNRDDIEELMDYISDGEMADRMQRLFTEKLHEKETH